ncbi:hypothetical protein D3C76_1155230 [compost metagenome]
MTPLIIATKPALIHADKHHVGGNIGFKSPIKLINQINAYRVTGFLIILAMRKLDIAATVIRIIAEMIFAPRFAKPISLFNRLHGGVSFMKCGGQHIGQPPLVEFIRPGFKTLDNRLNATQFFFII